MSDWKEGDFYETTYAVSDLIGLVVSWRMTTTIPLSSACCCGVNGSLIENPPHS